MQADCVHCGLTHQLNDSTLGKHNKVQFRCSRCGQNTIVEVKRRPDATMVISPMPDFARAEKSTASLRLPPADDGLVLPAAQNVVLTALSGPNQGTKFTLQDARAVIGRTGADIALDDQEISRHHCLLEVRGNAVHLKDLDSTNGTFYEEERVRAAMLLEGAEFRVGTTVLRLNFTLK